MQYSQDSYNNSVSTRNNLTYIENLINDAVSKGLYSVYTDGRYMDDDMVSDLSNKYWFKVNKRFDDFGLFPTYIISCDNG
jgi:hypothetical protein